MSLLGTLRGRPCYHERSGVRRDADDERGMPRCGQITRSSASAPLACLLGCSSPRKAIWDWSTRSNRLTLVQEPPGIGECRMRTVDLLELGESLDALRDLY
jgi:hypothetical protein